ncbi:MAG: DUF3877 family protein [bacterium]|nr:DUF3877 family protein [bacterium]
MSYEKLEQNLLDQIKEEQAKLGYMKEQIRLYYPLSSLNHFFQEELDAMQMQEKLSEFPAFAKAHLGNVVISHKGDRFCFLLPEEASVYVHEQMDEDEFILRLIDIIRKPGCTKEMLLELFYRYSDFVVERTVEVEDFDFLLYFSDGTDPYYYCFKDEGCHMIYHRYLPEDYEDLGL